MGRSCRSGWPRRRTSLAKWSVCLPQPGAARPARVCSRSCAVGLAPAAERLGPRRRSGVPSTMKLTISSRSACNALGEAGDLAAERGQPFHPLVGDGGLGRRADPDAAQDDGGQGGDGDQQDQPGAHAPVAQGAAGRRPGRGGLRLGLGVAVRGRPEGLGICGGPGLAVACGSGGRPAGRRQALPAGGGAARGSGLRPHSPCTPHRATGRRSRVSGRDSGTGM